MENKETPYIRSHEPIAWGLFGFGGMVIAFAMPSILICMIIAGITGQFEHFHIIECMHHWWGAGALFLIIMGATFHCFHRILYTLHDIKCHTGRAGEVICYGLATLLSIASGCVLCLYYFQT